MLRSLSLQKRWLFVPRICTKFPNQAVVIRRISGSACVLIPPLADPHVELSFPAVEERNALRYGCIDYVRGWAWQQHILQRRLVARRQLADECASSDRDTVLLYEHKSVYTLGRGADEKHLTFLQNTDYADTRERLSRRSRGSRSARLAVDSTSFADLSHRSDAEVVDSICDIAHPVLAPNGVPVYRVERGGEVTYHGPGQLVVYPLFDLQREPFRKDLHWFLRMVEEVIIKTLSHYGIDSVRDEANTGVWVGPNKVAAVGLSSSRWITTHGFALNVCPDLVYFDTSVILPCGIDGRGVTSIAEILKNRGGSEKQPSLQEVAVVVLQHIGEVFQVEISSAEALR